MDWVIELKKKFGGFGNIVFLIFVLVVCLRFSGVEWKDEELLDRIICAVYLILFIISVGIIFGSVNAFRKNSKQEYYSHHEPIVDFVSGLKYGIVLGTIVVFTGGLLLVDDYLGPIKEIFDSIVKKIIEKFHSRGQSVNR